VAAAGRGRIAVESEADADARRLAATVRRLARDRLAGDSRRADAVIYAGDEPRAAAGVAAALLREAPGARIVLPALPLPAAVEARVTLVGAAPAVPAPLAAAFRKRFGRAPGPPAVLGYEAMRSVLDAIGRAGEDARSRQRVIDAYLDGSARSGPLGTYRITPAGAFVPARFTVRRETGQQTLTVPSPPCPPS
jgi:ABC-type branched-subunit amino acid transport system substrate-binding protein